ncbi:GAF and ANTAR domain-containing protein [Actinopolymorpha cephalotaxi]|nr:GAF and ANTAR domain-containing protein [Actinopolymorpha cephalotaxi]NYH84261.1 tetrahydromethanopterin S-methyltransferase subunit F [Actinopolymorpha cephalotaxi]
MGTLFRTPPTENLRRLVGAFEELRGAQAPALGLHGLEAVAEVAVRAVSGATWASVTLANSDSFWTTAATHQHAIQADEVQYALGSGPCVDAIVDGMAYRLEDVARDRRWPGFGRRAAGDLSVASMLSCPVVLMPVPDSDLRASLNVYSDRRDGFDNEAVEFLMLLAGYGDLVATAVDDRDRARHLEQALSSNRDIGIAIGVLMATYKITRDRAFDMLKAVSQHTNRKMRDLATEVAETGMLADAGLGE